MSREDHRPRVQITAPDGSVSYQTPDELFASWVTAPDANHADQVEFLRAMLATMQRLDNPEVEFPSLVSQCTNEEQVFWHSFVQCCQDRQMFDALPPFAQQLIDDVLREADLPGPPPDGLHRMRGA